MNYCERLHSEIESKKIQLKILERKGDFLACSRISGEIEILALELKRYSDFEIKKSKHIYNTNAN